MEMLTIVRKTKDYLLIKVPLPKEDGASLPAANDGNKMTAAEKRLWRALRESEKDVRKGRVITAPSITKAIRRYEKRQWD